MPSSKASLDLEAWSKFRPQERANDFEYNILLYKFRSFYNEVKEFQELHSNCSVTRAILNPNPEPPVFGNSRATTSITKDATVNNNNNNNNNRFGMITPTSNNNNTAKQSSIGEYKKSLFQHQNSVPVVNNSFGRDATTFDQSFHTPPQNYEASVQHYNSSYNLSPSATTNQPTTTATTATTSKPEIKRRGPVSGSRFLISKSSEKLDRINNNSNDYHPIPLSSSLKNKDLEPFQSENKNKVPVVKDDRYFENDGNIYDAVSPDDAQIINSGPNSYNATSSIHNLNRLSLPQKNKLESSKSSLGLGSSAETSRSTSSGSKGLLQGSKSTPNRTNNNETIEHSNNSFGSSIILDATNSTSSLSMLQSHHGHNNNNNNNNNSNNSSKFVDDYANYVNIDFFLRRNRSPSYDGCLDENITNEGEDSSNESDDDDADTTQLSHSLSSDQICDDVVLKNMSPREIAKKFSRSNQGNISSSTSITPASSGDFLDEPHSSSSFTQPMSSSILKHNDQSNKSAGSFYGDSLNKIENQQQNFRKFSTNLKDSSSSSSSTNNNNNNKISPQHTLGPIQEDKASFMSSTKQQTTSSSQGSDNNKDGNALAEAQDTMRTFLSDLNLSPVDDVFEDKAQRRIVKESFAVEFCGSRKLRHLFLFNDVIVCAKYQASSKQKFTFDVKWYLNLNGVSILDMNDANNQLKYDKEAIENQILAIRTNLMLLRGQMQHIKRSKHKQPAKIIKKLKKKRTELEAELVLILPHLPLIIKHINGKKYTFFLSSNFDRNQWVESINFLQSQLPTSKGSSLATPSSSELQAWIQTCRKNLNPSLGTFLLRSNCDDDLLYGDLYVNLSNITGVIKAGKYYFCFEVDSYGHFSQKASSSVLSIDNSEHALSEEYIFPLDGAHTLRILLYEELGQNVKPSVIGKAHIELSRAWFLDKPVEKVILFNSSISLTTQLSYSSSELLSMRVPHAKLCPTFGMDITQVCKKEKTNVPLIIQLCVNEVERRGMREVGIYRMSGTSTDIQRLKRTFETNPHVAELLLRDIDINSVTGFLKTYLREMPEGLFTNKLYPKFVAAFNTPQSESLERTKKMLELFHKIPITNQHTIIYLVEHLVKIYKFENYNKMSLTNLATVLGPNILKPPTESTNLNSADPFTAVVIGSMSQAGILYFFLNRKFNNLPLTELDSSEKTKSGVEI